MARNQASRCFQLDGNHMKVTIGGCFSSVTEGSCKFRKRGFPWLSQIAQLPCCCVTPPSWFVYGTRQWHSHSPRGRGQYRGSVSYMPCSTLKGSWCPGSSGFRVHLRVNQQVFCVSELDGLVLEWPLSTTISRRLTSINQLTTINRHWPLLTKSSPARLGS